MYRIWFVRFMVLVAVVGFLATLRELAQYQHLANLYEAQPCRYGGEMTDKAELAIRRLKELPPEKFCRAVLFQPESAVVQSAVDQLLAEAKQEAEKKQPCAFCLSITADDLDRLGFDYSGYPYLVAAERFMGF